MTPTEILEHLLGDLDRELAPGWAHRCLLSQPCPGCWRDRMRVRLAAARKDLEQARAVAA